MWEIFVSVGGWVVIESAPRGITTTDHQMNVGLFAIEISLTLMDFLCSVQHSS